MMSSGAWAQSATPGAVIALPPVNVTAAPERAAPRKKKSIVQAIRHRKTPARSAPAATDVTNAGAQGAPEGQAGAALDVARLKAIPGGVDLINTEQFATKPNVTLSDTLSGAPGVVVQDFFGGNDQPRLQIRGSGLQQNPAQRGVLIMQDGLPINQADGAYIIGLVDPRQAESIEIYRGYTANRLGATTLGGALNLISPTGSTAPGVGVSLEGGSFGQISSSAQAGAREGNVDGFARIDTSNRDGYRNQSESDRVTFDANVGARLSDEVTTRFFAGYTDLNFNVPGPLPKGLLASDPTSVYAGPGTQGYGAGPNVVRDKPGRETEQLLLGNRTSATFGDHVIDAAVGYTSTDDVFRFPVSTGYQGTQSDDLNVALRYAYAPDKNALLPLFESSIRYAVSAGERKYYINNKGAEGALFGSSDLDSSTLSFNTGLNVPLNWNVTVSPGVTLAYATRDNDDTYRAATRPTFNAVTGRFGSVAALDTSYSHDYTGVSPSLGVTWRPAPDQMLFSAVSRSFEPPTQDDLFATKGGTPNTSPLGFSTPDLKAQTATTVEGGWRSEIWRVKVDAVTYYSWVENEILALTDASGVPLAAMNANQTRHFGVELGGSAKVLDDVGLRLAYLFQDFRFHDDPTHGDNYLAGAPNHIVYLSLHYDATEALSFDAQLRWLPVKVAVDNMNTLYANPYATVNFRASYAFTDKTVLYGEVRNIFDENYASSTLIVDRAASNMAAFLPGDGRAFYAGLKTRF